MLKNIIVFSALAAYCLMSVSLTPIFAQNENPVVEKLYVSAERDLDTGAYDSAIANYIKIIAIVPDDADAYNGRGFAYLGKHDYDKAIADFNKVIELKPDDFYTYYSRGKAFYLKGDYEHAIEDHTKELELESSRDLGRLERGNALLKLGRIAEAIDDFNRVAVSSDMPAGYYSRAMAFKAKGDKPAALADLRYYLQKIPDDDAAREQMTILGANATDLPAPIIKENLPAATRKDLAEVFVDVRQAYYNEAVFKLGTIIKASPNSAAAYFYRGYILETQASELNSKKFKADYDKAISLDPKFVEAYIRRGYRTAFYNPTPAALADLTRASTLDPKSARAAYFTALFYNRKDNWTRAVAFLNQAIKIDPNFSDAYITRAEWFEEKKVYDKAIADYSAVIKINPNDHRGYQGRAKLYCEQKKTALAAADEEKVVALGAEPDSSCSENK